MIDLLLTANDSCKEARQRGEKALVRRETGKE